MAKFYLATTLSWHAIADKVADYLIEQGHTQTYRWTEHGAAYGLGLDGLREVASKEMQGVMEAEVVVIIMPSKQQSAARGTHVELGAALALGKPVFILDPAGENAEVREGCCAFHFHPLVRWFFPGPINMETLFGLSERMKGTETQHG